MKVRPSGYLPTNRLHSFDLRLFQRTAQRGPPHLSSALLVLELDSRREPVLLIG